MNPSAHSAQPEYELSTVITTGMSAPKIDNTLQIFKITLLGLCGDTGTFYLPAIYIQYAYVFMDWAGSFQYTRI